MVQLVRSLLFIVTMYLAMVVMGIVLSPLAIWSRDGAYWAIKRYCDFVLWLLKMLCGLDHEIRGVVPTGSAIVVSKHQSFMDIIMLAKALPRPRFIMKQELKWAPILGFYAKRIGSAPVNRGKKSAAMKQMVDGVDRQHQDEGQLIIYPQGTRVPPGESRPYKVGAAVLYERLGQMCVPAATNVGVFWGKRSPLRRPGTAVLQFLEPIKPGLDRSEFLTQIETRIEDVSNALMKDAGFETDKTLSN